MNNRFWPVLSPKNLKIIWNLNTSPVDFCNIFDVQVVANYADRLDGKTENLDSIFSYTKDRD